MANITLITQNGKILATLQENQTVVLHTDDRKIIGDIVIQFAHDGQITYRGVSTKISTGKTATIKCNGLIVTEDIIVRTSQQVIVTQLQTPFIVLTDIPVDPENPDIEYNSTPILGKGMLGYLVLADDPSTPQLSKPTIYLFTPTEPEDPDTPIPPIEQLETPVIVLTEDPEEPDLQTLETPYIVLEDTDTPVEPEEPTSSAVLGEARLGYLVLGKGQLQTPVIYLFEDSVAETLNTPVIYLFEDSVLEILDTPVIKIVDISEEPEEPEPEEPVASLKTPTINIVEIQPQVFTLDTPVIFIKEDDILDTPYIYISEVDLPSYITEPNEAGTTIILYDYTEEPNDNGLTIIIN